MFCFKQLLEKVSAFCTSLYCLWLKTIFLVSHFPPKEKSPMSSLYVADKKKTEENVYLSNNTEINMKYFIYFSRNNSTLKSLFSPLILYPKCSIVFTSYFQSVRLLEAVFRLECSNTSRFQTRLIFKSSFLWHGGLAMQIQHQICSITYLEIITHKVIKCIIKK